MDRHPPQLGDLERRVLAWLWECDWVDVRAAHVAHQGESGRSANTLHSTLERLVRKRLVERRRVGRAHQYRAAVSRSDFLRSAITGAIEAMPGRDPASLLAAFVDVAERLDEAALSELERLVAARRRSIAPRDGDDRS